MKAGFIQIQREFYDRLKKHCQSSGQKMKFHTDQAMKNYMEDVFPVWESKLKEIERATRKH